MRLWRWMARHTARASRVLDMPFRHPGRFPLFAGMDRRWDEIAKEARGAAPSRGDPRLQGDLAGAVPPRDRAEMGAIRVPAFCRDPRRNVRAAENRFGAAVGWADGMVERMCDPGRSVRETGWLHCPRDQSRLQGPRPMV